MNWNWKMIIPGEWEARVENENGEPIAEVMNREDASLIAEAPEMLNAIRLSIEMFYNLRENYAINDCYLDVLIDHLEHKALFATNDDGYVAPEPIPGAPDSPLRPKR